MLRQLPPIVDPNVLVGTDTRDDAAIYRLSDDIALVATVDFFTPIVDDPYDFGRIAAANALSDVYAMGGTPLYALALVAFPRSLLASGYLEAITRGGAEKAAEAGCPIIGGHSIDDEEPKYGLSVTGKVHPGRIVANAGALAGDVLILTKPIGTGIIATAIKRGLATPDVIAGAVESMAALNRAASEAMLAVGVHAATDVTGFGLLGHLLEMTTASGVGARIHAGSVPVLPGTRELAEQGAVPGGTTRNRDAIADQIEWDVSVDDTNRIILYDAQTSGGLLMAVAPGRADELLAEMAGRGVPAARIGEVIEGSRIGVTP